MINDKIVRLLNYCGHLESFEDEFGTFLSGYKSGLIGCLAFLAADGVLAREETEKQITRRDLSIDDDMPHEFSQFLFNIFQMSKRNSAMSDLHNPEAQNIVRQIRIQIEKEFNKKGEIS